MRVEVKGNFTFFTPREKPRTIPGKLGLHTFAFTKVDKFSYASRVYFIRKNVSLSIRAESYSFLVH